MLQKNICKFTAPTLPNTLSISCFVLETNKETMQSKQRLQDNRIILVTGGSCTLCFDGQELVCDTGKLIFGFSGEIFSTKNPKNTSFIYISFSGTRGTELLRRFDINKSNRCFDNFDGLIPMWSESLSRASEQSIDLAAESILLYTFSRLTGATSEDSGIVGRIIELTEEHFKSPEISVTEIAKMLSYNPKYISHIFKEKMGVPFSEYLRSMRIKYAVSLLEHGLDSVKNVAFLSGFSDPLYFSSVFKKEIGVSPKDYVKKLKA